MEYDLSRFLDAQNSPVCGYETALTEMRAGRKASHWIWYIFPQIRGLVGSPSPMTRRFEISCQEEAEAYLAHPVLGPRLVEIASVVLALPTSSPAAVMGSYVDVLKLGSCMTLFASVPGADEVFRKVLDKYFGGRMDERTLAILAKSAG